MKRFSFLIAVLCLASQAFAGSAYEIKLTIKGVKNQTVQLAYYFGDKQYIRDSAKADENGKLTFKGEEFADKGFHLSVKEIWDGKVKSDSTIMNCKTIPY